MNKQPIPLRLADDLEKHVGGNIAYRSAAALRRLHEVEKDRDDWKESTILANQRFKLAEEKLAGLHEVNRELIKTLESIEDMYSYDQTVGEASAALYEARNTARAALAKAKGEV